MSINELLEQLDFSPNECEVYLAALKIGKGSTVNISREAKVEQQPLSVSYKSSRSADL